MSSFISSSMNAMMPTPLDKLGYIPLVGTVSGAVRIVCGIAKAVFSALAVIGCIITSNSTYKWEYHFRDGLLHVGRGFVELFPVVGGLITSKYDRNRILQMFV